MTDKRSLSAWQLLTIGAAVGVGAWVSVYALASRHLAFTQSTQSTQSDGRFSADSGVVATEIDVSQPNPVADDLSLWVQNELEFLREELESARKERAELQTELDRLTLSVSSGAAAEAGNLLSSGEGERSQTSSTEPVNSGEAGFDAFGFDARNVSTADIQSQALLQSGIDIDTVSELQSRQDAQSLARLELIDQAAREGWRESERFANELRDLEESAVNLREELGDDVFSEYLYNSGRPNRVVVQSIINGSAAYTAGVQIGDVIERYAGLAIFTSRDLRQATQAGVRNETVVLQVVRDDQPLALSIVRGPLGITMSAERVAPQ